MERACLKSVLRQGHDLTVYSYGPLEGVPEGAEVRDASEVLPEDRIIRHSSGSPSLFSNWFRYELQRRALGTWIDCDIYMLSPLDGDSLYLFGEEEPGRINTGILRIPSDSPLLPPLLGLFEERSVPPWLPLRSKLAAWLRLLSSGRSGLSRMPWGSAGPRALSFLSQKHGLSGWAQPPEAFCPMPWQEALWITNPAVQLEQVVGPATCAIHLWNERIKHVKDSPAAPGSFLERLQAEGRR